MNLVSYKRHRFAPDVICRVLGLSCKSYTPSAPLPNPKMPAQLDSALSTLEQVIYKYAALEAQEQPLSQLLTVTENRLKATRLL